ncbi:DNA-3-methyladenine glycosylase [Arsukibacterium sp. MJ3]|uniref:DNA-3-methyladenine glycosylase I n=1 Tax=Arsukibacterium sp. MJ3 TaxID=1632859 RepID=UPI0006272921|nr:DNA-3-methyladenine glycosylase I [Arsukibacterium sp. MJ3]KKO48252.1 DNA-3-methyladenine glycosylase [Arsukibacterium sp. MJ3]
MPAPCRCHWVDLSKPDYIAYHDTEWGVPVYDDNTLFEFLTLEAAQAGLSWYTVLKKRDNYRAAFAYFDPAKVAAFNKTKAAELLQNSGIIRNRLKIAAAINNAARFLEVQAAFGSFSAYQWRFVNGTPQQNYIVSPADNRATSPESEAMSKDLKKRGFTFIGSTIIYAHMQACGMVNDHHVDCFRYQQV